MTSSLKENVKRMIEANVPEKEIGEYIQTYGASDQTVAPKKDRKQTPTNYARGFFGGFNIGLTKMAGAPVDITNLVLSSIGLGSEEPVGGSKWMERQAGKISAIPGAGDPFPKGPDTTGGRIINRVGEELGASALPAAGMLRAASGVAPVARTATRGIIRGQILDPISRAPGGATLGEITAATGAGLGGGVAKEALPGNTTAETYGQLGGSLLPILSNLSPVRVGVRLYRAISKRFGTTAQKQVASDAIREVLGKAMTPKMEANLRRSIELKKKAPNFNPSVAESTGSPSLIAQQKDFEARAASNVLDTLSARR